MKKDDLLWAPWRLKYVQLKRQGGCIFCRAVKLRQKECIVFKTRHSICILNIFPYNNGHLMVAPVRHSADLSRLADAELLDLMRALNKAKGLLAKVLHPHAYNIGINVGRSAGAGITGHLHIHIVPRWNGDTNFMPVIHNTKVISESLDELCKRLKDAQS